MIFFQCKIKFYFINEFLVVRSFGRDSIKETKTRFTLKHNYTANEPVLWGHLSQTICMFLLGDSLTLKAPSKIAADDTFMFLLLSFEGNKV